MNPEKKSVALSSVFASLGLTLIKLIVGLMTGSIGILSEAAHSFLDLGAASLTYFAVSVGDRPPDKKHPYGHAKVESVSALIETGLLFLTSFWIIYEAVKRLLDQKTGVEVTWYSYAVIIIAIFVDYSRSRALQRIAKKTHSQALEADALHFSSDILSSLVVLIGLVFIAFGIKMADAIAAVGVSVFVLHAGWTLGKRTIDVLVDSAPEGLTDRVLEVVKKVEGVVEIKKIRVRPVGASAFVDMEVAVSRNLPLEIAQSINQRIEDEVRKVIPQSDITIQTKPLILNNETIIDQIQIIARNNNLSVHDIVVHKQINDENSKRNVSFDLEVNAKAKLKEAHKIASNLENILRRELGDDLEVNIHIEPMEEENVICSPVSQNQYGELKKIIESQAETITLIKETHNIKISKTNNSLFISLHCIFDDENTLESIHQTISKLEFLIYQKIPEAKKVLIHPEPFSEKDE